MELGLHGVILGHTYRHQIYNMSVGMIQQVNSNTGNLQVWDDLARM